MICTHEANDTAANQSKPGSVIPIVRPPIRVKNLPRGNWGDCGVPSACRCSARETERPVKRVPTDSLVVATRYRRCIGNIITKAECTV